MVGLIIGFAGMIVFIKPTNFNLNNNESFYFLLILFSSICYALSANIVKKVTDSSPSDVAITSTVLAALICLFHISLETLILENNIFDNVREMKLEGLFLLVF